ncbi:ADP-ribose pyrophosphatase [Enterococcus florum]|uniref:ADP-ribose pyrophosphatase n=1 Tax=Enterococcus florum TaxID=2480627 RepID=A0A4V0WPB1_9ENTE|nr:NUDIX hydrolase [Enterococcus florum]GCF93239.1 ADP-ribose pyrophosphatase [Enterococcus florum]
MLEYRDFEEKTIKRTEIFKGKIIDVYLDDVALPMGGTAKRELVLHNGGVGIIPITKENKLVMVKQFRKPLEKVVLEIPAGKIDPGEGKEPIKTAVRELEEETGYHAETLTYVNEMYLSPGFSNEKLYIYAAADLEKVEHPLPQDEDEVLELYELTLAEAKQAILDGLICDAKTIFAVQYWELMQAKQGEDHT